MNVGFYFGGVDLRNGGVAPYASRLFKVLSEHHFDDGIDVIPIWYSDPNFRNAYLRLGQSLVNRISDSAKVLLLRGPAHLRLTRSVRRLSTFNNIKLLHVPFQVAPECDIPYICTMHDVQELHFPQYFTSAEREYRAIHFRRSINNAAHVVVSYEHVKRDLVRLFGCPDDKVSVMPLPVTGCEATPLTHSDASAAETKFNQLGRFILYPAQTWQHKNHIRLIDAFEIATNELETPLSLVCTGNKNDHYGVIEKHVNRSHCRSHIHFTGLVSDHELEWLYKHAVGVVIPTLYEAGSFPLIESMMRSTPVICAKTTSLPETIGNPEFVFDPLDVQQMAALIVKLVSDQDFRAMNLDNGRRQIERLLSVDAGVAYEQLWRRVIQQIECGAN